MSWISGNDRFNGNHAVGRYDLSPVDPLVGPAGEQFEPVPGRQRAPPVQGDEPDQLKKRLDAQGTGTHRVLIKVGLEKPFVGISRSWCRG